MELMPQSEAGKVLEFPWKDVTFLVRARAVEEDRLEVWGIGKTEGDAIVATRADFARTLVRRFVVGWRGVTREGKEVSYSFKSLCESFPVAHGEKSVFLALSDFILTHTDFQESKAEAAAKNA